MTQHTATSESPTTKISGSYEPPLELQQLRDEYAQEGYATEYRVDPHTGRLSLWRRA